MKPDDVRAFTGITIPPRPQAKANVENAKAVDAPNLEAGKRAAAQIENNTENKRVILHEKTESGLSVIKISDQQGEIIREIPHETVQKLYTYLKTNDLLPEPGQHIDKES